jgi:hypothetical protein
VPSAELAPPDDAIGLVERRGETADLSMLGTGRLDRYSPIDSVSVPDAPAYLMLGVDAGAETMNLPPEQALPAIESDGRSPLTVEEGIALVTQFPESVAPNAGFSLAGSRAGDRRVTAFWISKKRPKLGWCWAGAPHTWLGTASCAQRVAG